MFKKTPIVLGLIVFLIISLYLISSSLIGTLTETSREQEPLVLFELEEMSFESDSDIEENDVEQTIDIELLTPEEEVIIGNKMTEFMALDEVKNLTTEEWLALDKELSNLTLNEIKRMSINELIEILRRVKN